jgi:hypothetical protein
MRGASSLFEDGNIVQAMSAIMQFAFLTKQGVRKQCSGRVEKESSDGIDPAILGAARDSAGDAE